MGVHVTTPEAAFVWTDSELVQGDCEESAGHCNKLSINSLAGMAFLGAGWNALIEDASRHAMSAPTLDDAARVLPPILRKQAEHMAARTRDPRAYAGQTVVIVGWSHSASRVIGYEMGGAACFHPTVTTRLCYPRVPAFDYFHPDRGTAGLAPVIREQMARMREGCPEIQGGTLVVAHISPGHVMCGSLYDLTGDIELAGAPSPPRQHSRQGKPSTLKMRSQIATTAADEARRSLMQRPSGDSVSPDGRSVFQPCAA